MKTLFLSLAGLLFFGQLQAQSCCGTTEKAHCKTKASAEAPSATAQFASLGQDVAFVAEHAEPGTYRHASEAGKWIELPVEGGKAARAYAYMAEEETEEYLFVIHEWWGLNDYIQREAEKYFNALDEVNVIALDLYDGKVATTQEEAQQYMQAVNESRARAIIQAALQFAGEDADIGTIGWCFGGGWSLQTAIMAGDRADACVMYYGMPEQNVEKLEQLDCPVLGIFAKQDGWISPEVVNTFEENMEKADKKLTVKTYDAVHAFANPSNPDYNKEAAEDAYQLAIEFLRKELD